jgi:predicted aspartyl protease
MNPEALKLRLEGPLIDATMSEPDGGLAPAHLRFMIDTGADITIVSRRVVDGLGMVRVRMDRIRGATGMSARAPLSRVHLALAGVATTFDVNVVALSREDGECDGLLGRDVLAHLKFVYDGPRGAFALSVDEP